MATKEDVVALSNELEKMVIIGLLPDGNAKFVNVGLESEAMVGLLQSLSDAIRKDLSQNWLDDRTPSE